MTSLSQLNANNQSSSVEVTDLRPAGVIFDRGVIQDDVFEISSTTRTLVNRINIDEIINYATANVRVRFTINASSSSFISASSLTINGLPTGITLATASTSSTKTYTLSGFKTFRQWDQIKTPLWTIPADYALTKYFWVRTEILYYDAELGSEQVKSYVHFDKDHYYVAILQGSAAMTVNTGFLKLATVAMTIRTEFNTDAPFVKFQAALQTQALLSAVNIRPRTGVINSTVTASLSLPNAKYAPASGSSAMSASATISKAILGLLYVRPLSRIDLTARFGPIGPGDQPYLEGNGFPYQTGLGEWPQGWPGIIRVRNVSANLTVTGSELALVEKLKITSANLTSSFTVPPTEVEQFKGVLNLNLPVVSTSTANFRVDYNSNLGTLPAISTVYARPAQKQLADASINVVSSLSTTANVLATATDMILYYNVQNLSGEYASQTRTVYITFTGNVAVNVNWGDGTSNNYETQGLKSHQYSSTGIKTITITRLYPTGTSLEIIDFATTFPNREWLTGIESFGNLGIEKIKGLGTYHPNLTQLPRYLPPSVTAFPDTSLPNIPAIASWNPVNVTNFTRLFAYTNFNQDIGHWDVSNATNMSSMFEGNTAFNQNIGSWNTSNVTNMAFMFYRATAFNQNISAWNTSKVTSMYAMFGGEGMTFNQPIGSWNVSNVTTMLGMFGANLDGPGNAFNQPLNSWNVSKVTNMDQMFLYCTAFNQPLNSWNTAKVTSMASMFRNASSFDQNISSWPVPLIAIKPSNFDTGTPATWITAEKPNWGV